MTPSFDSVDIVAVKRALPYMNLSDNQARSILLACSDRIAEKAVERDRKNASYDDAFRLIAVLIEERGGKVKIPAKALYELDMPEISRMDDPVTGDILFSTHIEEVAINGHND